MNPDQAAWHNVGPHLLGRKRHPGDERDYPMSAHFDAPVSFSQQSSLSDLLSQINVWQDVLAFWRWLKAERGKPTPIPTPSEIQVWELASQLDQGQTPHCVGFGTTAWRNATPAPNTLQNADAHRFYYDCKVADGEPKVEDGSWVHTAAKILKSRNEIDAYVWAKSVDDLVNWVAYKSPVIAGTDWDANMFYPNENGYVAPGGGVEGGHCYLFLNYLPNEDAFLCANSWGTGWGLNGRFKMKVSSVATLMGRDGAEFAAGIEIPAP